MEKIYYETAKVVGNNIKTLRKAYGFTQQDLADLSGLGRRTICNYEAGKSLPNMECVCKLCKTFNIKVGVLFNENLKVSTKHEVKVTIKI